MNDKTLADMIAENTPGETIYLWPHFEQVAQTFVFSDETGTGLSDLIDVDALAKEAEGGQFMGMPIKHMNRKELLAMIGLIGRQVCTYPRKPEL